MAGKPNRPCKVPGCTGYALHGQTVCARHKVEYGYHRNREYHALYCTRAWLSARKDFLMEHPLCASCYAEGRLVGATDVDHIVPHKGDNDLFWDRSNWQALCHACHSRKTAEEDGGFGNAARRG